MPFGIKDTSKIRANGRRLIELDNPDICPICNRSVAHLREATGIIPLAPIKIPLNDQEGFESILILGCARCYTSQVRLSFHTLEALIEYRENSKSRGRKPGSKHHSIMQELPVGELAKSSVETFVPRKRHKSPRILADFNLLKGVELRHLESLYESLGKVIDSIKNIAPEDEVLGAPDELDDIEAGMTDEQRARMDEAVAMAKAREGKVPQEVPNGW